MGVDEGFLHVVAVLIAHHALEHSHVVELQVADDQVPVFKKLNGLLQKKEEGTLFILRTSL